jgi:hypothetical protein
VAIVKEIGSYAGLAAVFGLAVLSALYFSQARDVRRLRDWAGRAPERASEQAMGGRAPVAQQPRSVSPAQPVGSQATPAPARVGAAAGASAPPGAGPAAAAALGRTAAAQAAARQAAARSATANGPGTNGPRGPAPRLPGAQTSILGASAAAEAAPWYRRLPAGRYLALIIAGVLIVGGGIAYGVTKYLDDNNTTVTQHTTGGGSSGDVGSPGKKATPIDPAAINVAVLNGTPVAGLARTEGDKVSAAGFQLGNVDNAVDKQRAESVVLFAPGRNREARLVSRKLGISQIEPADASSRARAPRATVIVVIGADRTSGG